MLQMILLWCQNVFLKYVQRQRQLFHARPPAHTHTCPNFITWGRQERSKGRATSVPPYVLGIRRLIPCLSSASSYPSICFLRFSDWAKVCFEFTEKYGCYQTYDMTISTWVPSSMSDVYCSVHSASIVPSFGHRLLARIVARAMASTGGPLSRSAAWSAEYKDIFTILTNGLSLLLLSLFGCAVAVKRVRPPVNR